MYFIYIFYLYFIYFIYIFYLFIFYTYNLSFYRGVGAQQCQEKTQEGKNEEKRDRGTERNHPPQPRQLMRV